MVFTIWTARQKYLTANNKEGIPMNFSFIIALLAAVNCISAARLGFHGAVYDYGSVGNMSPQQAAFIRKVLKIKCLQKYARRFC